VQSFLQDRHLIEQGLSNYWGYNTLSFFAPHAPYLKSGQLREMKATVKRLHKAGIELILDVVYNHTAEGNELGPTLSFRGIDNASYYLLSPDNPRHAFDTTGTGNTLNVAHCRGRRIVCPARRRLDPPDRHSRRSDHAQNVGQRCHRSAGPIGAGLSCSIRLTVGT
jgi:glycogen operon protein